MRFALIAAVSLSLVVYATEPDPLKQDKEKLQGTWTAVTVERDGKQLPAEDAKKVKVVIEGDKLTIRGAKDGKDEQFTYRLSREKKSPNWIDLRPAGREKAGERTPEKYFLGIYSIDGDTLKLQWQTGHQERVASFEAKRTPDTVLLVLKRE